MFNTSLVSFSPLGYPAEPKLVLNKINTVHHDESMLGTRKCSIARLSEHSLSQAWTLVEQFMKFAISHP